MNNISIIVLIVITLNIIRKDGKGIDGERKQKLLYRNHLTVDRTFSTINDVSISVVIFSF